jgi:prepilin peptidase CpaA
MEAAAWLTQLIPACVLAGACASATWTDLRDRTISNRVCYGALFAGLLYYALLALLPNPHITDSSAMFARNATEALGGALVCALALYPFWHVGGVGGGDVKFVAVMGMFLGPSAGLVVIGFGSLLAVVFCICGRTLQYMFWIRRKLLGGSVEVDRAAEQVTQPKALPLAGFLSVAAALVVLQPMFHM